MKKIITLLSLILSITHLTIAQNNLQEIDKLASTAQIWGFLKYYHPQVASGKFNWDEQLFDILPKVKNAQNKEQLSQVYLDWIESLGKVKKCNKCQRTKNEEYFDKNFDLNWLEDKDRFTNELSEKLKWIEKNRHQGKKHYVTAKKRSEAFITNEINYKGVDWQIEHYRLVSLFRYWNIIEYFFPYKYQADTEWIAVLHQMIPQFLNAQTELDLHVAMLELITLIDDGHAFFRTSFTKEFFGLMWLPIIYKTIDQQIVVTGFLNDSLAQIDDYQIGDIITQIDGKNAYELLNEHKKYTPASNLKKKEAKAFFIFNGSTDNANIEFIRANQTKNKKVKRYPFKQFNYKRPIHEKSKILDNNIGYINLGELTMNDVSSVMDSLINTKALILDIRNYPRGTHFAIAKYISSKRNYFYKVIYPNLNYPGKFIWRDGYTFGKKRDLLYKGKVVVLVNEFSQSQSEFATMLFQTGDNVITIGSQTSGADGNISKFEILGGYKTGMSGVGFFYPDLTATQRVGVKIDIHAEPSIQGIIEGRDEVLEKAIEYINAQP